MENQNTYQKFLKIEPYFHVLLWCIVLLYPYIKYMERDGGYVMSFLHELNSLLFKITISYFLYLWFFPKKNKVKYIPIVIIAFIANVLAYQFVDYFFHPEVNSYWLQFVANTLTYLSFGIVFFTIYTVKNTYKKQLEIDKLIQEKQQAEIDLLKSRVNPHFLFNTLNNIYANALKKDDKTPDLILKLSDSFRYILHEGQKKQVTLDKEITHIKDYISLQEERLSTKIKVDFLEDIHDSQKQIAPLLIIPFIENAFKYTSMLKGNKHLIKIKTVLNTEHQFYFYCENSYDKNKISEIETNWQKSGIGIKNTKKRLQLLYPERHQLLIEEKDNLFKVTLTILL